MRKLRVLLVVSVLLLIWGTVVTPTMAFSKGPHVQSAVVLSCRETADSFGVYDLSPPNAAGVVYTNTTELHALDCATTIGQILNNRCSLQQVIPIEINEPGSLAYVFTCVNTPL